MYQVNLTYVTKKYVIERYTTIEVCLSSFEAIRLAKKKLANKCTFYQVIKCTATKTKI